MQTLLSSCSVSESANDPVFGKEALNKNREDAKPSKVKEPSNKLRILPRKSGSQVNCKSSFVTTPSGATKPLVSHGAGPTSSHGNPLCHFCSGDHDLDECELFSKKTPEQKRAVLREKRMCFGCYGTNHLSRSCLNRRKCKRCGRSHPSSLHIDGFQLPRRDSNSVEQETDRTTSNACTNLQSASCHTTRPADSVILHAILPVRVRGKGNNKIVTTYALYDNGCSGCFLTENLREQIGVVGRRTEQQLSTMHG